MRGEAYRRSLPAKRCPVCGIEFSIREDQRPAQFLRQVNCSTECGRRARHIRAQRERPLRENQHGYLIRFVPGRTGTWMNSQGGCWVLEHRLVMEQHLGRDLQPDEHVHHKNHDKHDNRIENLEILSRDEHLKLHGREKTGVPRPNMRLPRRPCQWCGEPIKQTKPRVKTCSIRCGQLLRFHGPAAAPTSS